ncbi:MAG: hypothetical protein KZQ95_13045 [Candidatus Thiodiazotropha sp. (ex Epidulcina cf. delphinae)]|nr:hypothetical protein [Candidatus Thiodiazotropha sp. (ex Epidulcina cf. delphinae)]
MSDLILFIAMVMAGFFWKVKRPAFVDKYKHILHKLTWYNLLLVVLFQFWSNGLETSYIALIVVGFMLHVFPVSIAIALKDNRYGLDKYFLAYSTFGGGNRGVLAVALLSPALLPQFFILDVGIFISLLLVYPIASRIIAKSKDNIATSAGLVSFVPVAITSSLIIAGVILNEVAVSDVPKQVFQYTKTSLLFFVSLYLGVILSLPKGPLKKEIVGILASRVFGVFLPVAIFSSLLFSGDFLVIVLSLVALASFLPVSSLAPQLTSNDTLREWMTAQVIISSGFYIVILLVITLIKTFLQHQ